MKTTERFSYNAFRDFYYRISDEIRLQQDLNPEGTQQQWEGMLSSPTCWSDLSLPFLERASIYLIFHFRFQLQDRLVDSLKLLSQLPDSFVREVSDRLACGMAIILRVSNHRVLKLHEWELQGTALIDALSCLQRLCLSFMFQSQPPDQVSFTSSALPLDLWKRIVLVFYETFTSSESEASRQAMEYLQKITLTQPVKRTSKGISPSLPCSYQHWLIADCSNVARKKVRFFFENIQVYTSINIYTSINA